LNTVKQAAADRGQSVCSLDQWLVANGCFVWERVLLTDQFEEHIFPPPYRPLMLLFAIERAAARHQAWLESRKRPSSSSRTRAWLSSSWSSWTRAMACLIRGVICSSCNLS
jgi:hypothetical protein